MRRFMLTMLALGIPSLLLAQEVPVSDAVKLRKMQIELNTCDLSSRQARKLFADELQQLVERAEKAEQALVAVQAAKTPAPKSEDSK